MDAMSNAAQEERETSGQESVFPQLKTVIEEVIGADAAEFFEITRESAFVEDLEMDSIQVVQFAESVNDLYGDQVDFITWLSQKPFDELLELRVGDISSYIENNLNGAAG
jgi:acyl carrier protein